MHLGKLSMTVAAGLFFATTAFADEHVGPITKHADAKVKAWISDSVIIDAVKAQNAKNASLSQADIDTLDKQWRAETGAGSKPMIDAVLANALSDFLKEQKAASNGLYTEIFVMDNKGLNVGQSDITSDYWQGDEAKWKKTFLAGTNAVHVGKVKKDESTQKFQSQLSLPIVVAGKNIGAITIGVNIDEL